MPRSGMRQGAVGRKRERERVSERGEMTGDRGERRRGWKGGLVQFLRIKRKPITSLIQNFARAIISR